MTFSASLTLLPHPGFPCPHALRVGVDVSIDAKGGLCFHYFADGDLGAIIVPPASKDVAQSVDLLWQHTCCEAFLTREGNPAYREFNFSPSGQWAAYGFAQPRQRDPATETGWRKPPAIVFSAWPSGFELCASLAPEQIPDGPGALKIGLSAVMELGFADGGRFCTYWALHHPEPHPDFHHRDAFTLTID